MSVDKLESTNRLLHDLERKLSISSSASSTAQSHASHGSVVQDPAYSGVARQNIQSSVLSYIKNNGSNFDAGRVYATRQQKFSATAFGREYSPSSGSAELDSTVVPDPAQLDEQVQPLSPGQRSKAAHGPYDSHENYLGQDHIESPENHSYQNHSYEDQENNSDPGENHYSLDYDYYENDEYNVLDNLQDLSTSDLEASPTGETFSDDDLLEPEMLLPPSPPRMPPRELDPDKLYGIYDFSGPDPSHCTLSRDEPVYLRNDSDNYWWLIQKLSKSERLSLWNARGSEEDLFEDDEHGKIGFVPAECLETYEERLARLNCFRNENLDQDPLSDKEADASPPSPSVTAPSAAAPPPFGRKGSILKKSRAFKLNNKSVTFESLEDGRVLDDFDSDDGEVDFSDHYYSMSHDDIKSTRLAVSDPDDKGSEVLSDVFPSEVPLQINKKSRKKPVANDDYLGFDQPNMHLKDDRSSIGSFSPDTPQQEQSKQFAEDAGQVRRSVIIDRLHLVTSDLVESGHNDTFGGVLHGDDAGSDVDPEGMIPDNQSLKTQSMEEVTTPRASILNQADIKIHSDSDLASGALPREKKRAKPVHDMFTPLLGKLDELTEKLAELEQSL